MEDKLKYIESKITNNEINKDSIMMFITKHNIIYSKNQNGIFINLSKIKKDTLELFYNYIHEYANYNCENKDDILYYKNCYNKYYNKKRNKTN